MIVVIGTTDQTAINICEIDMAERCKPPHLVSSVDESIPLFKLARNIDFFIRDYTQNTIPILEGVGSSLNHKVQAEYPPDSLSSSVCLSGSEVGRLQRAFCRFESYRGLFARCSATFDRSLSRCERKSPVTPKEQSDLFLKKLPDYQTTEIHCIRDYLTRRLWGTFSAIEDHAVNSLTPQELNFTAGDPEVHISESRDGLWFFGRSGKSQITGFLEHLLSLGLPYMRRLLSAPREQKWAIFTRQPDHFSDVHHLEPDFLTSAIQQNLSHNPAFGDGPYPADADQLFTYEKESGVELEIPEGWVWAHPRAPSSNLRDIFAKGLRDLGFVFWDTSRLHESDILEKCPGAVHVADFDEFLEYEPSVQDRLFEKWTGMPCVGAPTLTSEDSFTPRSDSGSSDGSNPDSNTPDDSSSDTATIDSALSTTTKSDTP